MGVVGRGEDREGGCVLLRSEREERRERNKKYVEGVGRGEETEGGRECEREIWGWQGRRERDKGLTCHRCHESVDRGLLKSLLRMLVDLQVYQEVFEIKFLHETETTYRAEALRMMRDPEFTVSKKKN